MRWLNNISATVDGSTDDLFILTGDNPQIMATNNSGALTFLSGTQPVVGLNSSDSDQNIYDSGSLPGQFGVSATVEIFGGLVGRNLIVGFADDPGAVINFVSGDPSGEPTGSLGTVGPDGAGGTLITFLNAPGTLDVIGDNHFGIGTRPGDVAPHHVMLRNL